MYIAKGVIQVDIIENYADLLQKIEIIKAQIELLEHDAEFWFGEDEAFPFASKGANLAGVHGAWMNLDRINAKLNQLNDLLDYYCTVRDDMNERLSKLNGLEYKIAYMRFIEDKNYKEIASELEYSYDHIRRVASKTCHNHATLHLVKS